jgi:hypothetical protein
MKLFSAFEDFVIQTLASFPSKFGKLRFIAEMRSEGKYQHWGLSKTYGDENAQKAIAEAHSDAFEKSLTTPVPVLTAEDSAGDAEKLSADTVSAVPGDLRGTTERHFRWVLKVVELLKHSSGRSSPDA